jgi:hypothetical protein
MSYRIVVCVQGQLAQEAHPSKLAKFLSELPNPQPIGAFLTADGDRRRLPKYERSYSEKIGLAEFVATNGLRVVYLSIDRVTKDQADRIAESMNTAPIANWDVDTFRGILKAILGNAFETEDVAS